MMIPINIRMVAAKKQTPKMITSRFLVVPVFAGFFGIIILRFSGSSFFSKLAE